MHRILKTCKAKPKKTAWKLADDLWKNKDDRALPTRQGGLANFVKDGKSDKGENRLDRIIAL